MSATGGKSPYDAIVDRVVFLPIENPAESKDGIPVATHEGVLEIAGFKVRVYQLSTGHRVIAEADMMAFLDQLGEPGEGPKRGGRSREDDA